MDVVTLKLILDNVRFLTVRFILTFSTHQCVRNIPCPISLRISYSLSLSIEIYPSLTRSNRNFFSSSSSSSKWRPNKRRSVMWQRQCQTFIIDWISNRSDGDKPMVKMFPPSPSYWTLVCRYFGVSSLSLGSSDWYLGPDNRSNSITPRHVLRYSQSLT